MQIKQYAKNKFAFNILLVSFIFLFTSVSFSETNFQNRKRVAVVLSGGGAKGFAQIGVLQAIEEAGIPIDMVIGTSAGALVGGLYCSGHTPSEIETIVTNLNWPKLFLDTATDSYEKYILTRNREAYFLSLGFTNKFKMEIGSSLITGQHVLQELKAETIKIPSTESFDDLPTPFRAIAIEILTGKIAILDKGDLAEAMRASMNLPALFSPFSIDGTTYIDGGITQHLPVQIAKDMGYEIVIAIDTGDPLLTEINNFNANPVVALNQMINIGQAEKNTNERQLATLLIKPKIDEYSLANFAETKIIIQRGKEAAEESKQALLDLKEIIFNNSSIEDQNNDKNLSQNKKKYLSDYDNPLILQITTSGILKKDTWFVNQLLNKYVNKTFDSHTIKNLMSDIYDRGNYQQIQARLISENDGANKKIKIIATPISKKNNEFKIGLNYASTISTSSAGKMQIKSNVTFKDITTQGSVFAADVSFIDSFTGQLQFFQPLPYNTFIEFLGNYENNFDVFYQTEDFPILLGSQKQCAKGTISTGFIFGPNSWTRLSSSYDWLDNHSKEENLEHPVSSVVTVGYDLNLNTLERKVYPTQGNFLNINFTTGLPLYSNAPVFSKLQIETKSIIPVNSVFRFSFSTFFGTEFSQQLTKETALRSFYAFKLSDRIFFPHCIDSLNFGSHKIALGISAITNPLSPITPLGGEGFFSLNASVGNIWENYDDINITDLTWCTTAGLGVRISDGFSLCFRIGIGIENDVTKPVLAIDIGSLPF